MRTKHKHIQELTPEARTEYLKVIALFLNGALTVDELRNVINASEQELGASCAS